ncbi:MAG: AlpA family phage regulatory protein [Nioella sp.]
MLENDSISSLQADKEIIMHAAPSRDTLIGISTLVAMLQRSRASIYRDIKANNFPKPLKLGSSSRWLLCEVEGHIANLAADRPDKRQQPSDAETK